jgi:prepilin-type N-terminal cleavage/methylation domain-containing protein
MVTMKKLQQPKGSRGFTLIELMISVCIMAIAFAGLATMQIACINGNAIASNLTTAITLAQDQMELLNSLDPDTDPNLVDNNTANNANLANAACDASTSYPAGHDCQSVGAAGQDDGYMQQGIDENGNVNAGGKFDRTWNIADDTPTPGTRTVAVIVTWQNLQHRVSVSSILN